MTTASAISRNSSVEITHNMWSEATKLATDGYNNASIFLYKRIDPSTIDSSGIAGPSGTLTYTFSTGELLPDSSRNGWSREVPPEGVDKYPCYFIVATASTSSDSDDIAPNEWTEAVEFSSSGINTATINLYKRSSTNLVGGRPFSGSSSIYDFSDNLLTRTGGLSGWNTSVPTADGNPCYVTSATAVSRGDTATIDDTKWSDVTKLVEDSCSVMLTNDNHTFAGTSTSAIASSVNTSVLAYKGSIQVKTIINDITADSATATDITSAVGAPTGMTVTVVHSNSTQSLITVSVSTSMSTRQCVLTIPVKVDNTTYNLTFSYSVALAGNDSTSYNLSCSSYIIVRDKNNNLFPGAITFAGYYQRGINSKARYSGRFKIYTSDNGGSN
jgi:hypothetical protein